MTRWICAAFTLAFSATTAFTAEPNDTWADATNLGLAREVTDQIDFTTPGPDTTLGLFDEQGQLLVADDDGSFFGNGLASAVTDWPVNADGSVRFSVSGFGDNDFDGLDDFTGAGHAESGDFGVLLTVKGADGHVIESRDLEGTLTPGEAIPFPTLMAPEWLGGSFDLELNNFFGPPSDTDFWTFTGVPSGTPFVAEVIGGDFDTFLGWYNDAGELIDVDDDGGLERLSRLEGVAPASGAVHLAVTAYPDFSFAGVHSAVGEYTLRLTAVPEPLGGVLAAVSLASAWGCRRRR